MTGRKKVKAKGNVDANPILNTIGEQDPEALEAWKKVPTEVSKNILSY